MRQTSEQFHRTTPEPRLTSNRRMSTGDRQILAIVARHEEIRGLGLDDGAGRAFIAAWRHPDQTVMPACDRRCFLREDFPWSQPIRRGAYGDPPWKPGPRDSPLLTIARSALHSMLRRRMALIRQPLLRYVCWRSPVAEREKCSDCAGVRSTKRGGRFGLSTRRRGPLSGRSAVRHLPCWRSWAGERKPNGCCPVNGATCLTAA